MIMPQQLNPEQLARLRAEATAPYRGLRRFIYLALAGSAFLGGVVFLAKVIAGEQLATTVPNLLLQVGAGAGLLWLWQRDRKNTQ
jgi:hypothetical protein